MGRGSSLRALLAAAIAAQLAVATVAALPRGEPSRAGRAGAPTATAALPSLPVPPRGATTTAASGAATPVSPAPPEAPAAPSPDPVAAQLAAAPSNRSTRTLLRVAVSSTSEWATVELQGVRTLVEPVVRSTGGAVVSAVGSSEVAIALRGTGAARLDVVAEVPVGAVPVLRTCKSHAGDLEVRTVRDTGTPAGVAELRNDRSDGAITDGCENPMSVRLTREALLGPTPWPTLRDDRRLTLAFYYPWFDETTFATGEWRNRPHRPWNTDHGPEVDEMVALAGGSGVDGFVVSYNHHPATVRRFDLVLTAAEAEDGFVVAPLLELGFLAHQRGGGPVGAGDLEQWMRTVLARSSSPAWLRVGDRPVVFLYGREDLTAGTWREVRSRLNADGIDPFVMGEAVAGGFDFEGLYQYSPNVVDERADLLRWYRSWERHARLEPELHGGGSRLWAAPVSPGQDDALLGRPPEHTLVVDRRGGDRYDEVWGSALDTRPEWVLVTSWNEFYENTEIAPSRAHGRRALEQTARWARGFAGAG